MLEADSVKQTFVKALGKHSDIFTTSIIELMTGDASLQKCEPKALIQEALRAATLNLPLSKSLGYAYIVAFNNTVKQPDGSWAKVMTPTFVIGYKGLLQLAQRTAQYRTINADKVYEGELSRVDRLTGTIALDGERKSDKVVGYFCHFELLNGFSKTLYMSVEDCAKYAKRYSPSVRKDTTVDQLIAKANETTMSKAVGWEGNFNDMAIKTCVRRLIGKYGYMSVEIQDAFREESEAIDTRAEMVEDTGVQEVNLQDVDYAEVEQVHQLPESPAETYIAKSMEELRETVKTGLKPEF